MPGHTQHYKDLFRTSRTAPQEIDFSQMGHPHRIRGSKRRYVASVHFTLLGILYSSLNVFSILSVLISHVTLAGTPGYVE